MRARAWGLPNRTDSGEYIDTQAIGILDLKNIYFGMEAVDKVMYGQYLAWSNTIPDQVLVYDATTMIEFTSHTNTQLVAGDTILEATAANGYALTNVVDQEGGDKNFSGIVTDALAPLEAEFEFANISTATQTDILTSNEPMVDGDNLVIVKDDDSIVEYSNISGVTGSGPYSYTLDPTIGEIPTRAYSVDAQPSLEFGSGNGFQDVVKSGDSYVYTDNPALLLTDAHTAPASPTGTVSASSQYNPNYSFKLFDADDTTYWQSTAIACWVEYAFTTPQTIATVRIQEAEIRSPQDFTLEYSLNGTDWVVMLSLVGVPVGGFKSWAEYTIPAPVEAGYFRMNITKGRDTVAIWVQEIELISGETKSFSTTRTYNDLTATTPAMEVQTKCSLKATGDRLISFKGTLTKEGG